MKDIDISQLKFNRDMNIPKKEEPKKYSPTAIMRPKTRTYKAEEIFFDIEGDPDNIIFKVPEAVAEDMQWNEGDTISIEADSKRRCIILKKVDKK